MHLSIRRCAVHDETEHKSAERTWYEQFLSFEGMRGLRSGEWLLALVERSLRESGSKWHAEALTATNRGTAAGIRKLTHAAARRAALAGVLAAGAISLDEVVVFGDCGRGWNRYPG